MINFEEGKNYRLGLWEANTEYINNLSDWLIFATFTFRDDTHPDKAIRLYKNLIQSLNQNVYGKNYRRIVKHSYFSYVMGIEYQRRNVIHFHALFDAPVNFMRVHFYWNKLAGFAWLEKIQNLENVTRYISKYVLKSGDVEIYKKTKNFEPKIKPGWWHENKESLPDKTGIGIKESEEESRLLPGRSFKAIKQESLFNL